MVLFMSGCSTGYCKRLFIVQFAGTPTSYFRERFCTRHLLHVCIIISGTVLILHFAAHKEGRGLTQCGGEGRGGGCQRLEFVVLLALMGWLL